MKSSAEPRSLQGRKPAPTVIILGMFAAVSLTGCPAVAPVGSGGDQGGGATAPTRAEIITPSTSFGISALDPPISVLYSVPATATDVRGYRVPVSDFSPGAVPVGDRAIVATELPAGERLAFNFDPQEAGVGLYRVGILFNLAGTEQNAESRAVIQVQGSPNPIFIQPTQALTQVPRGTEVFISFDVRDPEGTVQWRLFLLSSTDSPSNPANDLGRQLAVGSGNVGTFTLQTDELDPGDYRLGVSATDSGGSVANTAGSGESDRIVTIPSASVSTPVVRVAEAGQATAPTIAITAPGTPDVVLYRDDPFTIRFSGAIHEPGARGTIEVFYDLDDKVANGFTSIASELSLSTTSIPFPTGVAEGAYRIGATIRDGINPSVTVYAAGKLSVVRTVTLDVTAPATSLPAAPGKTVDVKWTTNAPAGSGTVDVFAQTVDASGNPFGAELAVVNDGVITTQTAQFASGVPGLFEITVRLNLKDATVVQDAAPQHVRVTSLPPVLWLGSLADSASGVDGAIFGGVNFEDNAGTSFTTAGDLDGDHLGEFVIGARYGKPFFTNPTGVGPGEAYLIYGQTGTKKLRGEYNLNSVGTTRLPGVTFAGIRTPQGNNQTDGMSSVSRLPDVDGDGRDELVFGFPDTASRGHNVSTLQDGVIDPRALATLERENQFLRGGIVIVSSENSFMSAPGTGGAGVNLDLVGQKFESTCVDPEPDADDALFYQDITSAETAQPPCEKGTCEIPKTGGKPDATTYIDFGFVSALARDYFYTYVYSFEYFGGVNFCDSVDPFLRNPCREFVLNDYCAQFTASCEPFSPGLHANADDPDDYTVTRHSGYYVNRFAIDDSDNVGTPNLPLEPFGARIIGVGLDDKFGTSLTLGNATGSGAGDIIVTSPGRTARGILLGPSGGPESGGEIDGLESPGGGSAKTSPDSGVAYLFPLRSLWTDDAFGGTPPKPHQYIVGEASHSCAGPDPDGDGPLPPIARIDNIDALRIAGFAGDKIERIVGIDDFNNDGRDDFAIGAPNANVGQGRVYIAYRRAAAIEGDYVLEKLALAPDDPERLTGFLVVSSSLDGFGASLAGGFDFNGDKIPDLVVGSPTAAGGAGEVIILFGGTGIISPANGITIDNLLSATRTSTGAPVAARIRGNALDTNGQFGFNIANAGDIDGDGLDDLLVAAPNATPRFDPQPNDATDTMTAPGVDLDFDGMQDDVPGDKSLTEAGLVYVIFGSNRLDQIKTCQDSDTACSTLADCPTGKACGSTNFTININQLGKSQLHGLIIAGRRAEDRIGGGDAGEVSEGGIVGKKDRGRSDGLAAAGDVDGDKRADILIGSILADPRRDPNTGVGVQNGGEAYLIYGSSIP